MLATAAAAAEILLMVLLDLREQFGAGGVYLADTRGEYCLTNKWRSSAAGGGSAAGAAGWRATAPRC